MKHLLVLCLVHISLCTCYLLLPPHTKTCLVLLLQRDSSVTLLLYSPGLPASVCASRYWYRSHFTQLQSLQLWLAFLQEFSYPYFKGGHWNACKLEIIVEIFFQLKRDGCSIRLFDCKRFAAFKWTVSKTTNLCYILNLSMLRSFNSLEYELCQIFASYLKYSMAWDRYLFIIRPYVWLFAFSKL